MPLFTPGDLGLGFVILVVVLFTSLPTITAKINDSQTNVCRFTCLLTTNQPQHGKDLKLMRVSHGYVTGNLLAMIVTGIFKNTNYD